jgi:Family of unknown function (DUF6011)
MRWWRGDYVIVFPERWAFHSCIRCGRRLTTKGSQKRGIGPECADAVSAEELQSLRARALERDRARYRAEVLDAGLRVERTGK